MKQTIEVYVTPLSQSWLAVAHRAGDMPLLQVQAPSERDAMQELCARLLELRDGIDELVKRMEATP